MPGPLWVDEAPSPLFVRLALRQVLAVGQWAETRRLKFVERLSQREIRRRTSAGRDTIRKALSSPEPPSYGRSAATALQKKRRVLFARNHAQAARRRTPFASDVASANDRTPQRVTARLEVRREPHPLPLQERDRFGGRDVGVRRRKRDDAIPLGRSGGEPKDRVSRFRQDIDIPPRSQPDRRLTVDKECDRRARLSGIRLDSQVEVVDELPDRVLVVEKIATGEARYHDADRCCCGW